MRFKKGEEVRIKCFTEQLNGMLGVIKSINGEYHYVQVNDGNDKYTVEVYRCELEKVKE